MLPSNYILFCDELKDVVKKYPNLKVVHDDIGISFLKGIVDVPNDANEIVGSFLIEVHFSIGFPYHFPILYEVGGSIPNELDWHKYANGVGNCCITVRPDEIVKCKNGMSVILFIENHVVPYLANHIHRKVTGKYKNGEYAHDAKGFHQFYVELLKTDDKALWIQYFKNTFRDLKVSCERNDTCFCGSGKKYKHCHLEVFNTLKLIGVEQIVKDFKFIGK